MRYCTYFADGMPQVGLVHEGVVTPLPGVTHIDESLVDLAVSSLDLGASCVRLDEVDLLAASSKPSKVVCVGLNYRTHILETGRELPQYPVLFPKFASNLIGAHDPIHLPPESQEVDYEGELAIIIGRGGRRISQERALEHVLGLTVANDITMRDYQYKTHQWMQGKCWDASTPLGPVIVPVPEVDVHEAVLRTTVNGNVVQESSIGDLVFNIPTLIATVSQFTRLDAGDVILTGTPGGVGYRRKPRLLLSAGDTVIVEIDGVGRLENRLIAEPAS